MTPDVLPKLLIEIRDDSTVTAIAGANPSTTTRVRGFEPGPDDAHGPGEYRAFVVLAQLGANRFTRAPVQTARLVARCYGRTPAEAADLRWACSNAIHSTGARVHSNGLGIYNSLDDTGGSQERDPSTQQPLQTFIIEAIATTQAVV